MIHRRYAYPGMNAGFKLPTSYLSYSYDYDPIHGVLLEIETFEVKE